MFSQIPLPSIDNIDVNAIRQRRLASNKNALENEYFGPTQEANIASKTTYARYLPSQILGQVLSNPLVWQTMDKEQLHALTEQYTQSLTNPPDIESLTGIKHSKGIFPMLMDFFNGKSNENKNAFAEPKTFENKNPMSQEMSPNISQNNNPINNGLPSGGLPNTTINRVAPNYKSPGAYGGINPTTVQGAQAKGLETTATSEAASQTSDWSNITKRDSQLANSARQNLNYLDKLAVTQPKLKSYEKGRFAGSFPAFSDAATEFDTYANALANSVAAANEEGHITDAARNTYFSMKPNRTNPDLAFKNLVKFNQGMNARILELPAFNNAAKQLGLEPGQAQSVWTYYSTKKPFYDAKSNKVLDKNLGTWEDFLTERKIVEALSPKLQKVNNFEENNSPSSHSEEDINFTAKKHGMTPDEVKKILGSE